MRRIAGMAAICLGLAAPVAAFAQAADPLTMVLPREADIALALSAAPEHLREAATVYVFTVTGYELAREGTNGFTCLNNRDSFFYDAVALKPTCWDAAGADSYVPVMLDVAAALAAGTPHAAIVEAVEQGFATGRYKSPGRTGIAYMLAGDVMVDEFGAVTEQLYPGHYMFYAPGVTSADIGYDLAAAQADPTLPFVFASGAGGGRLAYMIVAPVGHAGH
jgi:hypothetical protein